MSVASFSHLVHRPDHRDLANDRLTFRLSAAVVFLSPFNVIRTPGIFFTAADLVTLLGFFVLLSGKRLPLAPLGRLTPAWHVAFLALSGGLILGSIVNHRLVAAVPVILQYGFAMIILPWVLGGGTIERARRLLMVWVIGMVVVALHGVYVMEFATNPSVDFVSPSGRLRGLLERETELGAILAMAVVATAYLASQQLLSLGVSLLFTTILLYGIVLTASNTGILALASGLIPFTLLQRSRPYLLFLGVIFAIVLVVPYISKDGFLPQSFTDRVVGALTTGDLEQAGTFSDRVDLTREGWQVSQEHVLIGLGAEGFREVSSYGQPVHNTYVLLLVEGGVLSLAGLCAVLGVLLIRGATLWLDNSTRNLGAFVIATAVLYGVALNAFPHIYARFYFVPLVLVTALASFAHDRRGRIVSSPRLRSRSDRGE